MYKGTVPARKQTPASLSPREQRMIARALADPRRFEILKHIAGEQSTACSDLLAAFPISAATLSHHLKELESAGLIETPRRGKFVDAIFCREKWQAYLAALAEL